MLSPKRKSSLLGIILSLAMMLAGVGYMLKHNSMGLVPFVLGFICFIFMILMFIEGREPKQLNTNKRRV